MFAKTVYSKYLFLISLVIKFQIFIVILARVFYLVSSIRTPLGDGGGGGI